MKKNEREKQIEHDVDFRKLKAGDTVILSRHDQGPGHGEHYFTLGKVKKGGAKPVVAIISSNYFSRDMDLFVESVTLAPEYQSLDITEVSKRENVRIHRAPDSVVADALRERIRDIDSEITKLADRKARLVDFYDNEKWKS